MTTMSKYPALPTTPLAGQTMPCLVVHDGRVQIAPSLDQLDGLVVNPLLTEDPKSIAIDKRIATAAKIRSRAQRQAKDNKGKRDNIPQYSEYIKRGAKGEPYVTPAMCLVALDPVTIYQDVSGMTYAHFKPGALVVHTDGETQFLARKEAATDVPDLAEMPIACVLDYGHDVEWAAQAFHDLNLLAVPLSAAIAMVADTRDPANALTRAVAELPVLKDRVQFGARQLSKNGKEVLLFTALRRTVVGALVGKRMFAIGNKPLNEEIANDVADRLKVDFNTLLTALQPHLTHESVLTTPVALGALGIALHETLVNGGTVNDLIALLGDVLWDKSTAQGAKRWAGIAGKLSETGTFSAGGGMKDTGYRVLEALTKPESDYGRIVRGKPAGAQVVQSAPGAPIEAQS